MSSRRGERGQSMVEIVLFLPIMLFVLLIAVDFSRVFMGWITVNNMARIGANYAALNPQGFESNDAGVKSRYEQLMLKDAASVNCSLPSPLADPQFSGYSLGDTVRLDIECDFELITPFLSALVGDGSGNVPIAANATFMVRSGSVNDIPVNPPVMTPPPTGGPAPTPTPTPTPDPDDPLPPVDVSFYGQPAPGQDDVSGGGPPGSIDEHQIVGLAGMRVDFVNTTVGDRVTCLWDFGDGTTQENCANSLSKIYGSRGLYSVTLTVNGVSETRPDYVLVSCKVPVFVQQVRRNNAANVWSQAGFTGPVELLPGNGNYVIQFQSVVGNQVNPPDGCQSGITVGP
jgi:hypothetical protein